MKIVRRQKDARPASRASRRGVTTAEMAIVLMVFLTIVFGMIELSIAVFRYHVVSQAARQLARRAIVHGELAGPEMTDWYATYGQPNGGTYGPKTVSTTDDEIIDGISGTGGFPGITKYVTGLEPARTTVTLTWATDGSLGSNVTATVETKYSPFVTFLFTSDFTLTGESTMQIAH